MELESAIKLVSICVAILICEFFFNLRLKLSEVLEVLMCLAKIDWSPLLRPILQIQVLLLNQWGDSLLLVDFEVVIWSEDVGMQICSAVELRKTCGLNFPIRVVRYALIFEKGDCC